jgi:DNA replication licensing factor MCM2
LSLNTKNGFPVFATVVEANYVAKKQDLFSAYKLTDEDKADIEKLSKDPRISERVCHKILQSLVYDRYLALFNTTTLGL